MTEDAPEELLGELFNEKLFPENALGLSIAGTPKTVRSFNAEITQKISPRNHQSEKYHYRRRRKFGA